MTGPPPSNATPLARRLRAAGEAELAALLAAAGDELGLDEARQALRNPFVTGEQLAAIAERPALAGLHELRRELAGHPRTPRPLALRLLGHLYWRDLAAIGTDATVHPLVRRTADRRLLERLPGLAEGERCALARRASAALVSVLRFDASPRVVGALLENPRLTEPLLVPLAAHERAPAACLAVLAAAPRWATRAGVRSALCRNPATPPAAALRLLPGLARDQLAAVAADPRLAALLREGARRLLAGVPGRPEAR